MQLLDANGNPIKMEKRPDVSRAGAVPVHRRTQTAAGEFSSPEAVKAAWNAAKSGDTRPIMRLADEIENDLRIAAMLRQRTLAVSLLPVTVKSADDEDDRANEIAESGRLMLQRINSRQLVRHLQSAILRPFAAAEIVWAVRNGRNEIDAVVPRLGGEFRFDFPNSGEQLRIVTDPARPEGELLPPAKFVVHYSTELSARILSQGGLVRGASARWVLMTHVLLCFLKFADVYGMPWRIGKYTPGVDDDEQIAALKRAVAGLGVDAGAVIPADMEIQIIESVKNSGRDVFTVFIDLMYRDIAVGILGQTLTSMGSDMGAGTQALGTVHEDTKDEITKSDAAEIGDVLTEQLLKPYVIFNYGEQEAYPQVAIDTEPGENLSAELDKDRVLVSLGLPLSEDYFYQKYGRPKPTGGEKKLKPPESLMTPFELASNRPFAHPLARARERGEN